MQVPCDDYAIALWFYLKRKKNNSSFLELKAELCSDYVLIPFDPTLLLHLTTDACTSGLVTILNHSVEGQVNKLPKPIIH